MERLRRPTTTLWAGQSKGYVPGYKALIPYHGRTSIQYVLDALQGVPSVRRICIEGPSQLLKQELAGRLSVDLATVVVSRKSYPGS